LGEDVAAAVVPLGVDGQGRLRVACHSRAWQRQVEALQAVLAARLNRELAGLAVTGIVVEESIGLQGLDGGPSSSAVGRSMEVQPRRRLPFWRPKRDQSVVRALIGHRIS
jgi:hypothetical protein